MARQSVAYRLVSEGKDQLINDFRAIAEGGDASAKKIARAFERDMADAEKALAKLQDRAAKLEMAAPNADGAINRSNPIFGGSANYDVGTGSARHAASALFAEQDRLIQQRNVILAQIDPLFAAQMQYNAAIERATDLRRREILSEEEFVSVQRAAKGALDEATRAHGGAVGASNAMRAGMQQAGFQVQDFVVQVAGGTSATRAFSQQAPQMIGSLQLMAAGAENGKGKFAQFANVISGPWGIALGIAIPVAGMLAEKLLFQGDAADTATEKLKKHKQAVDLVAEAYNLMAGAMNQAGAKAIEAQQAGELRVRTGEADVNSLRRSLASAEKRLADSQRVDPRGKGSAPFQREVSQLRADLQFAEQQLATSRNFVAEFERRRIEAEQLKAAAAKVGGARAGGASNMAEINAMAKLEAATNDVERAQAKLTLTRKQAQEQLKAGKITEAQATAQISAAETTLNNAQAAQQAMTKARRDDAKATREAAKDQRELMNALMGLEQQFDPAAASARKYQEQLDQIDKLSSGRKPLISSDTADEWRMRARSAIFMPGLIDSLKPDAAKEEESAKQDAERKARIDAMIDQGEDELRLAQKQHGYKGRIGAEEAKILELEEYRLRLKREFPKIEDEELGKLVAQKAAQIDILDTLAKQSAAWQETTRFGEDMVDRVLNPENWNDFGDLGKTVLRELANEMWKLAAINPLKNLLFNSGLPTMFGGGGGGGGGGLFGSIAKGISGLFGGGGAAIGTEYASGGAMWLAENGPELVNLPRGARVTPAAETRRLLAGANDNRPTISFAPVINAPGADAAALARVEAELQQMRRDMPSTIAQTMVDVNRRTHGRWQGR